MQAVGLELVTQCRVCEATVAINAIVTRAACPKCGRAFDLDPALWGGIFSTAIVQVAPRTEGFEVSTTFAAGAQTFRVLLRRVPLPAGLSRRAVPDGLAPSGIAFVAGEDLASMRTDARPTARAVHCPQCGAPLEVAAGARDLHCVHCGNTSVLEGEDRFVGRSLQRFFLGCDVGSEIAASAVWEHVESVSVDESDRVYVLAGGQGGKSVAILALDRSLAHVRWMKTGLERTDGAQLIARGDRVVLARKKGDAPLVLNASDGEPAGAFPPPRADLRFDPKHIRSVAPMPDGSWLLAVSGEAWGGMFAHTIFHRCDAAGAPLPTWDDEMARAPEIGTPLPELKDAAHKPLFLRDAIDVVGGFDGTVLLTDGEWLAKLTRSGEVVGMAEHPQGVRWSYALVGLDGTNRVHALTHSDVKSGAYLVFDPRGNLVTRVERKGGTHLLGKERRIAAALGGGAVLVGYGGRLRVIRPDGTLGYVSAAGADDDRASS
jgi:predicted RNA-binding Zn-ribbon protein involved in translation (DUF1610 family)